MSLSLAEENYLKVIYQLSDDGKKAVSTNEIANALCMQPASVTDMLKKLFKKKVITYQKYYGANISKLGKIEALKLLRKHRLWEVFLVDKLKFSWDEVEKVAEQLKHINSPLLIKRLDEFLGFPQFDPHGEPIPSEEGQLSHKPRIILHDADIGSTGIVVGVKDSNISFLQYLDKIGIYIGAKLKVQDQVSYDGSFEIWIDNKKTQFISKEVAQNILITT